MQVHLLLEENSSLWLTVHQFAFDIKILNLDMRFYLLLLKSSSIVTTKIIKNILIIYAKYNRVALILQTLKI